MRKFIKIFVTVLTLQAALSAAAWGRLGHDAVAYIAERHLTPKAKENIERYLDNHSIVYYASWMDMVRYNTPYSYSGRWHANCVDSLGHYFAAEKRDAAGGVNQLVSELKNRHNMTDSAVAVNIKLLVHIVGDIHCPSHAIDDSVNPKSIKFTIEGAKVNLHSFWDTHCLNHHNWNYLEFGHQLDKYTDEQVAEMAQGTPADWANESGAIIITTYDWFENGKEYDMPESMAYKLKAEAIAHPRLVKAGYRLARILNDLFDEK